ncbi:hypothetical protein GCM10009733_006900 [Nonomuraea maheshkhaliensis]|uniref:Uncharacterized protein n=1 Tax=Nonomuraea maheshkhaliensis TaxID=419590 RepID=A0ABP4QQF2_9ACTN
MMTRISAGLVSAAAVIVVAFTPVVAHADSYPKDNYPTDTYPKAP